MEHCKKVLITLLFVLCGSPNLIGQTVFWHEDFGSGCTQGLLANLTVATPTNGAWTVTQLTTSPGNGTQANDWFISATESGIPISNCGESCINSTTLTNRSLHVAGTASQSTDYCASIGSGGNTNKRVESAIINCSGQTNILFSFHCLATNYTTYYGSVEYFDGALWNSLGVIPSLTNSCVPNWSVISYTLPPSVNNNTALKIGFVWQNSGVMAGTLFTIAIDEITLSGTTINRINEYNLNSEHYIKLFPNPSSYSFILEMGTEIEGNILIITNALGQAVHQQSLSKGINDIKLEPIPKGLYYYSIIEKGKYVSNGKFAIE